MKGSIDSDGDEDNPLSKDKKNSKNKPDLIFSDVDNKIKPAKDDKSFGKNIPFSSYNPSTKDEKPGTKNKPNLSGADVDEEDKPVKGKPTSQDKSGAKNKPFLSDAYLKVDDQPVKKTDRPPVSNRDKTKPGLLKTHIFVAVVFSFKNNF